MSWNDNRLPRSMNDLPPITRAMAIEIVNALLEEGYEEGEAVPLAIALASRWVSRGCLEAREH
jgi:uncharacterized protein YdaT